MKREQSGDTELTCQLIQYVMGHFQEPLARELHVNKYYISNLFSRQLGTHFRQYLNRIRLDYAMQPMRAGNAPLVDVWAEAGFNSQRSFNRAFSEIMGMAPDSTGGGFWERRGKLTAPVPVDKSGRRALKA